VYIEEAAVLPMLLEGKSAGALQPGTCHIYSLPTQDIHMPAQSCIKKIDTSKRCEGNY
jgi:hypothetical protein